MSTRAQHPPDHTRDHPPDGTWIFGYGSLVWRPAFPFAERRRAAVVGWSRRFWQGSTDHRGVPGAPGRVVTLVAEPGATCWGVAFRLRDEDRDDILAGLDHREQGGYDRVQVEAVLDDAPDDADADGGAAPAPRVAALLYVANERNANYLGPAPLAEIARQVRRSRGPSGDNVEYVLQLDAALRELGIRDRHVAELAAALDESARSGLTTEPDSRGRTLDRSR